jgi:hypothetical protein
MKRTTWADIGKAAFAHSSQQLEGYINALADWVECQAIARPDFGCDKVTLTTALTFANWTPPVADIVIDHDGLAEDVFIELASRSDNYGDKGYPFKCDFSGRLLKFTAADPWPYVFLLALSYTNPKYKVGSLPTGAFMLEALSWEGLRRFIGEPSPELIPLGVCHHFGSPSLSGLPLNFDDKIDKVAKEFREGGQYKPLSSGHRQKKGDGGVDIILRRGFPDDRGAQFLVFGACAGGDNWATTKHDEADPDKWLKKHFRDPFHGRPGMARCYFVPRHIDRDGWLDLSVAAGMVIDRCRLALITHKSGSDYLELSKKWTEYLSGQNI